MVAAEIVLSLPSTFICFFSVIRIVGMTTGCYEQEMWRQRHRGRRFGAMVEEFAFQS